MVPICARNGMFGLNKINCIDFELFSGGQGVASSNPVDPTIHLPPTWGGK
jgi:hypothetical protein